MANREEFVWPYHRKLSGRLQSLSWPSALLQAEKVAKEDQLTERAGALFSRCRTRVGVCRARRPSAHFVAVTPTWHNRSFSVLG